jgi:hypothetical protein
MGEAAHVPAHSSLGEDCALHVPVTAASSAAIETRPSQRFNMKEITSVFNLLFVPNEVYHVG